MKKYNIIKGIASFALSFFLAGTANAAIWNLEKTQLAKPGEMDTLRVVLENNSFNFTSFQMDIALPEGVLVTGNPILDSSMANGQTVSWETQGTNAYRCVAYSVTNSEMLEPQGTLLNIPVQLTAAFQSGTVSMTAGLLANSKSETMEVTDFSVTVTAEVKMLDIAVNVSGLEQTVNPDAPASIDYTTIPAGLLLTEGYFTDEECTTPATDDNRKAEGTVYVKLSFPGNETYNSFEKVYAIVLTTKKDISSGNIIIPTASPLLEGQLLSTSLLTGGSATDTDAMPIPGEFVWTDGNTFVQESGEYSVTFIPQNQMYYNTKEVKVYVTVNKTYLITAVSSSGGVIKLIGQTEDNIYAAGQSLTLEAVPDANYRFVGWTKNGTAITGGASMEVTAESDVTYFATFEPIEHQISLVSEGEGSLTATANGTTVGNGASVQQGTTIQVVATPGDGWQLSELTVNNDSLKGDKLLVEEASTIKAVFTQKQVDMYTVTVASAENGRVLIYKQDGSLVASGSTVPVNTQIRAIVLPNAGYQYSSIMWEGTEPADIDDLHIVRGDVVVTPKFEKRQFTITAQSANSNHSTDTPAGSIKVDKTTAYYGETVKVSIDTMQDGAILLYVLANGKEIQLNEDILVTSDMTITAVFDHRVDILKEYIMWPYQECYYSGVSRNFVPFASQTYAGFSFEVSYKRTKDGNGKDVTETPIERAIDAGEYTVILHRDEDGLYNEFNEEYEKGLTIKKSTIAVTKAPELSDDPLHTYSDPETRPSGEKVVITYETYDVYPHLRTYTIEPNQVYPDVVNNYNGTVFYHPVTGINEDGNLIRTVGFTEYWVTYLRSAEEPKGGLRITNGGLPYEADEDGNIDIIEGTTVTFEAVPVGDYKFVKWADNETENPRTVSVEDESITSKLIPEFALKSEPTFSLVSTSSVYNASNQTVSLTGDEAVISTCQVSFYSDEACTQPAALKNAGTYYIRVYRPADTDYKASEKVFTYTISPATPEVVAPEASEILAGETLSKSQLMGGHAGIVAGSFAWAEPSKVATASGEYDVVFTPVNPNYTPVTLKVAVSALGADAESDEPSNPSDEPNVPTGLEEGAAKTTVTAKNQAIIIRPAQPMTVCVVNMMGAVLYLGDVADVVSVPVGNTGVYIVKMTTGGSEDVRKIQVR